MITNFPDPYPDELVYSIYARYSDSMHYPTPGAALEDWFGVRNRRVSVNLPLRLDHIIASLPPSHLYSANQFIDNHSLFPFYAPFLSAKRADAIRGGMRNTTGDRRAVWKTLFRTEMKRPSQLRFCPECAETDRRQYGETYWHRIHQITGVEVCPVHSAFIKTTEALRHDPYGPKATSAEKIVPVLTPTRNIGSDHIHNVQVNIARFAAWLLQTNLEPQGTKLLRERYFNLLLKRGFAYHNGRLAAKRLLAEITEYYSINWLRTSGFELHADPRQTWVMRVLYSSKGDTFQSPFFHILLLIFLEQTAEEFFTAWQDYKPFGDGPWPCLNHAADHYRDLVIKNCEIVNNVKKFARRPLGTFSCDCGFTYTRTGPDQRKEDRLVGRVRSFGSIWEERLRRLWEDRTLALQKIGSRLGVTGLTVKRHALRLGLTFPRNVSGERACNPEPNRRDILAGSISLADRLDDRRLELLQLIKANPNSPRSQLRVLADSLFRWLGKYDPQWLEIQLPAAQIITPKRIRVHWVQEDMALAAAVRTAISDIRSATDPQARISIAEISKRVGHVRWFHEKLDKLPVTAAVLGDHLESVEDFFVRRIEWTAECYRRDGISPSATAFKARARLRTSKTSRSMRVRAALAEALRGLRKQR